MHSLHILAEMYILVDKTDVRENHFIQQRNNMMLQYLWIIWYCVKFWTNVSQRERFFVFHVSIFPKTGINTMINIYKCMYVVNQMHELFCPWSMFTFRSSLKQHVLTFRFFISLIPGIKSNVCKINSNILFFLFFKFFIR